MKRTPLAYVVGLALILSLTPVAPGKSERHVLEGHSQAITCLVRQKVTFRVSGTLNVTFHRP
jgi:hypothetical protein